MISAEAPVEDAVHEFRSLEGPPAAGDVVRDFPAAPPSTPPSQFHMAALNVASLLTLGLVVASVAVWAHESTAQSRSSVTVKLPPAHPAIAQQ